MTVSDEKVSVTSDADTLSKIDRIVAVLPTSEKITGNYSGSVPLQAVDRNGTVLPTVITPFEVTMKVITKPVRTTNSSTTTSNASTVENSSTTAAETKPDNSKQN